jgi:hypothetical protein
MRSIEDIVNFIESNSLDVIKNIDYESVDVFDFLKEHFQKSDITHNYLFQFVYRSFYRLDNAGLTPEFKTEYFNILEQNRNLAEFDFEWILKRLYKIPNWKGQHTFQFSFVTKMYNTINNKIPIYDSEVIKMFSLKRPEVSDFNKKLELYLNQFQLVQETYELILDKNLFPSASVLFDQKFSNHNLDQMKKLDFIFWSAGKLNRKYEISGDNN